MVETMAARYVLLDIKSKVLAFISRFPSLSLSPLAQPFHSFLPFRFL